MASNSFGGSSRASSPPARTKSKKDKRNEEIQQTAAARLGTMSGPTLLESLLERQPSRALAGTQTAALFGPKIAPSEIPITAGGEAFREYFRQRQLPNNIGGLVPAESVDIFNRALQGDYADVAKQYGLDVNDVRALAENQVSPFTANQREAQARNLALARQGLDPAYGAAVGAATGQLESPYNDFQLQASQLFGGQAAQSGVGMDTLAQTAMGGFVGQNPYLDAQFGRASERITDQFNKNILPSIEARFARSGRYGSDEMQRALLDAADLVGDQMTDLATGIYGGAYGQERALQQQAAQTLGGFGLQSAGQLANLGNFGQDQQLQAATLAPALADAQFAAGLGRNNVFASVGDQQRALMDQLIGRVGGYYDTNTFSNIEDLERLAGINSALGLTGADAMGGVGNLQPQQSKGASIAGGALTGAAAGATLGPWGAAGGAVLGGIAGAL